jgi:acetate kinase
VLETGFHRDIPEHAARYGVPETWIEHGVRRYGFHGASHRYVGEKVPAIVGVDRNRLRMISCHLGGSSSICAIDRGRSVDVTMGFSPQSGLENATRHGDLDPFAVLYMMDRLDVSSEQMRRELLSAGGLAGISGIAGGDVRDLEEAASQGNRQAALALETFAYQVRKTIGAYAAAMAGVDVVAFTGGIGENATALRERCCRGLEFLDIRIDAAKNSGSGDRVISIEGEAVQVVVLATNEELIVARETAALLSARH